MLGNLQLDTGLFGRVYMDETNVNCKISVTQSWFLFICVIALVVTVASKRQAMKRVYFLEPVQTSCCEVHY